MKWFIPAKTFLVGEYAAVIGGPAILLTTNPCFELVLSKEASGCDFHPASPAYRWWERQQLTEVKLTWHDPYQGLGGMGASSAQFLGTYLASQYLQNQLVEREHLLEAYMQCAWHGEGMRPSGYDVLAQASFGCVYIDRTTGQYQSCHWPFEDLAFVLVHTGQKLATHDHLQSLKLPDQTSVLSELVGLAKNAFEKRSSLLLIEAVNAYREQLLCLGLVAMHSMQHVHFFQTWPDVLAAKGCGAMGSDVVLLLIYKEKLSNCIKKLSNLGLQIIATHEDLYRGPGFIENKLTKRLEISR